MGAHFIIRQIFPSDKDSIIGERVVLDGRAKLTIGNHVDIASEVMIYNAQHDMNVEHFAAVENYFWSRLQLKIMSLSGQE